MKRLTDKEIRIYNIIKDFINKHKYPPTYREIGQLAGLNSVATISYHLERIKDKGYIYYPPKKNRTIELVRDIEGNLLKQ